LPEGLIKMKVLIFGGRGFLGSYFHTLYPQAATPFTDIADARAVAHVLEQERPDVVINAAGKTGWPNIDWCEDNKLATLRSNLTGPLVLLEELSKRNIYWVQIGSGCIYQGDNGGLGFREGDPPNFFGSFYSSCKAWLDQALKGFKVLTLRLRMPFDSSTQERNLLMKLRKYSRVLDIQNSMTCVGDFLEVTSQLIKRRAVGVYNVCNTGSISPYEIMQLYREIVDPEHSFVKLSLDRLPEVAKAPRSNCLLNTDKLKREGLDLPSVRDAVRSALSKLSARELPKRDDKAVLIS
jgi:dTDP-4-dehydrorhamnose reductase